MKLTVRRKLLVGFSLLIFLIGILGGFGVYNLSKMNSDIDVLYNIDLKGIEHIKDAQVNLISLGEDRSMLILSTDTKGRETAAQNMKDIFVKFEKNIEAFTGTVVLE